MVVSHPTSRFYSLAFCLVLWSFFVARPDIVHAQRLPWQQHVRYRMDVTLKPEQHRIEGSQRLVYVNNSPDTLDHVFYHLYYNAFRPDSRMADWNRHLPDPDGRVVPRIFRLRPNEIGAYEVGALSQDGTPVRFRIDDTVMRVDLARPIAPGDSSRLDMAFSAQIPLITRRGGRDNNEGIEFTMSQWYPKMAAYDRHGWHADPYLGREFYAPFGSFDVRIKAPSRYVLGGTGVVMNPEDVGHGYAGDSVSPASAPVADTLTWIFHAENVHDFAWVADPDYIHDRFTEGGIIYHVLYQPDVASTWESLKTQAPLLMQYLGQRIGPYPYPQFTIAQAGDGGMEYPMAVFITGRRSPGSLFGTTAHEAAHQWFYGILGSNETDYAWMDEGLSNYVSTEAIRALTEGRSGSHTGAFMNLMYTRFRDLSEPLNTHSDHFRTNTAYSTAAYAGGQVLTHMLGYVISDSLRDETLRSYYQEFKFGHPQPMDLEAVAEKTSGLVLDWFFRDWTQTTRTLDYAVRSMQTQPAENGRWRLKVDLVRKDAMEMPVDLLIRFEGNRGQWVNIPLSQMFGHKPVDASWYVADPWPEIDRTYRLDVTLAERPLSVEIDPAGLTPDRNRLNNRSQFPLDVTFFEAPHPDWFRYHVGVRPTAGYTDLNGPGIGLQGRGLYLFGQYPIKAFIEVWPRTLFTNGREPDLERSENGGSWWDGLDFEFTASRYAPSSGKRINPGLVSRKHLGVFENQVGISFDVSRFPIGLTSGHTIDVALLHQDVSTPRVFQLSGLLRYPELTLVMSRIRYVYTKPSRTTLNATLETGQVLRIREAGSGDGLTRFVFDGANKRIIGPLDLTARVRIGLGVTDLTRSRRFLLGAGTLDEHWSNPTYRFVGGFFGSPLGWGHLAGLTAGPVAYLGDIRTIGSSMAGATLRLGPTKPVSLVLPVHGAVFISAGKAWNQAWYRGFTRGKLVADAGLELSVDLASKGTLQLWKEQSDILSGLRAVARFPLWASHPEWTRESDRFAFRWTLGIQITGFVD